jgi:RimJ/RimL family protein N-acetyltransferase
VTTTLAIPTVETARLRLRAPGVADFEAYAAFRGSERSRILGGPLHAGEAFEQLAAIVGHWQLNGFGRWIVADRETDEALGVVGPFFPLDWPEPEIAWSVFEAAEGKGIAFEAAQAARAYAYGTLGWTTAISLISADNARSIAALARRLGCREDGIYQHPKYGELDDASGATRAGGGWHDPDARDRAPARSARCAAARLPGLCGADGQRPRGHMGGPFEQRGGLGPVLPRRGGLVAFRHGRAHGRPPRHGRDRRSGRDQQRARSSPNPNWAGCSTTGHEGQGYATEAARALRDWAFDARGLPTLVSYVDPGQRRLGRVARRLGGVPDPDAPPAGPGDEGDLVFRHSPGGRA